MISKHLRISRIFKSLPPSILILFWMLLFTLLQVDVTALLKRRLSFSFIDRWIFRVLLPSVSVSVLFDCLTVLISLLIFLSTWFLNLWNLIIFCKPIRSFSNGKSYFTCLRYITLLQPYPLCESPFLASFFFFVKIYRFSRLQGILVMNVWNLFHLLQHLCSFRWYLNTFDRVYKVEVFYHVNK